MATVICFQVNGCTGKMGKAVIQAAISAGLHLVPVAFSCEEESGQTVEVCGKEIKLHGPSRRENILASVVDEYPNLIVVDYTVPDVVNGKNSHRFLPENQLKQMDKLNEFVLKRRASCSLIQERKKKKKKGDIPF